jgi:TRAP-type C4-dicarboxylate transport system permease small subunit
MGQIYAQGDLYRKAIETPTKPIVLIGMWLLCGPTALGASGVFVWFIWEVAVNPREWLDAKGIFTLLLTLVFVGGCALIFDIMLFRLTRNYFRRHRRRDRRNGDRAKGEDE